MMKLKCVTVTEGEPKIETILVNPDHVVCIVPHENNNEWSRVNLLDDYEFTVEGTPDVLARLKWREP